MSHRLPFCTRKLDAKNWSRSLSKAIQPEADHALKLLSRKGKKFFKKGAMDGCLTTPSISCVTYQVSTQTWRVRLEDIYDYQKGVMQNLFIAQETYSRSAQEGLLSKISFFFQDFNSVSNGGPRSAMKRQPQNRRILSSITS